MEAETVKPLIAQNMENSRFFPNTELLIPEGYQIQGVNIIRYYLRTVRGEDVLDTETILKCIVYPTEISSSLDSQKQFVHLTSYNDTGQILDPIIISRPETLLKKGMATLIEKGVIFNERDWSKVIDYITDCIQVNIDASTLQHSYIAERNGWKRDRQFVIGKTLITSTSLSEIHFADNNNNMDKLLPCGDLESWITGNSKLSLNPVARFTAYAALSATLLNTSILDGNSFTVDISGSSSLGKTSIAMYALSHIGNPTSKGLRNKGDSTIASIEETAKVFSDLPIFYDDTTNASPEVKKFFIYTIGNEAQKGRAKAEGGNRETGTWKTVAITTGESPLLPELSETGGAVRIISLTGGLGKNNAENATYAELSKLTNSQNYGHILPLYIQKLLTIEDGILESWQNEIKVLLTADDNLTRRLQEYFSIIYVSGRILEYVYSDIGMPTMDATSIIIDIWKKFVLKNKIIPQYIKALEIAVDGYHANKQNFHIGTKGVLKGNIKTQSFKIFEGENKFASATYGVVLPEGDVCFNKNWLTQFLYRAGIQNPNVIFREWRDNDITKTSGSDITYMMNLSDKKDGYFTQRMIRINLSSAEKILNSMNIEEDTDEIDFSTPAILSPEKEKVIEDLIRKREEAIIHHEPKKELTMDELSDLFSKHRQSTTHYELEQYRKTQKYNLQKKKEENL